MSATAIVIEDDEDLSIIFSEALQAAGYQVETVLDGAVARQRLTEIAPEIILLDLHLPRVSGVDLLSGIQADARFASTRVIIATADIHLGKEFNGKVDLVLIKPISFTQLRELTWRMRTQGQAA
jgi:DNA-binding response OmpR family regulator